MVSPDHVAEPCSEEPKNGLLRSCLGYDKRDRLLLGMSPGENAPSSLLIRSLIHSFFYASVPPSFLYPSLLSTSARLACAEVLGRADLDHLPPPSLHSGLCNAMARSL